MVRGDEEKGFREVVKLPFKDHIFTLQFDFLDLNIDVGQLTKIDYNNLYGEIITVAALVNKIGIIRAEAEALMDRSKLDREIKYAQLDEHYRKSLRYISTNYKKEEIWKDPNNDTVEAAIKRDNDYIILAKRYINRKKEFGFVDSLFWACKDKAGILKKIGESLALTPEEFENNIVEGAVNGMMLKKHNRL